MKFTTAATILFSVGAVLGLAQVSAAQETAATAKLRARSVELREEIIRVADGVYTAVGYSPANSSMIVGTDGIVIIDTGLAPPHAQRILAEFRKITPKPVKAIIYTHGHADHTNGSTVFAANASPEIWARSNFGSETQAWAGIGLRNPQPVGADGQALPADKRINNGVALAFTVQRPAGQGMAAIGALTLPPTKTFTGDRQKLEIAGIRLELVAAPGETADELYVWLPDQRVLFAGDNFYRAFPNLYPLRGAQRNPLDWADSVDKMLKESPDVVVPGHTRPFFGKQVVAEALTDYRNAIRYVFEETIKGMNQARTPDDLAATIQLPANLRDKDYLQEFYGTVAFSVRSIYAQNVGWFDGNATSIAPFAPVEQARRVAALAGGEALLLEQAKKALGAGDAQWAAQLADALILLQPTGAAPKLLKAAALEFLAERTFNAPSRNYYLEYAQLLRKQAQGR